MLNKFNGFVFLLLLTASRAQVDPVLSEDLNTTELGDRVFSCSFPEVVVDNACTCDAGYYLVEDVCVTCPAGKFKDNAGPQECSNCANYMSSFAGATSSADCMCIPGYALHNNVCALCEIGFYKDFLANSSCLPCIGNATTESTGTSIFSDCKCEKGFYGTYDTTCTACPLKTYKTNIQNGDLSLCVACPANSVTLQQASTLRTDCLCNVGYAGTVASVATGFPECIACLEGSYKNVVGSSECQQCQLFSTSEIASTTKEQCLCISGYQPHEDSCIQCVQNFYCPGQSQVYACMLNSTSAQGVSNLADCNCIPGYYKSIDELNCLVCTENFYCVGNNHRKLCPDNSTSTKGSYSANQCVCDGGYERVNSAIVNS